MEANRPLFLTTAIVLLGGLGLSFASVPFLASWRPSSINLKQTTSLKVDLSHLWPGKAMTVIWQNKPVLIIHRTQLMLDNLSSTRSLLRDPYSTEPQQPSYTTNEYRSINPEYLVLIGLCTHLGCPTQYKAALTEISAPHGTSGFYCPCHGSIFDLSGRVIKGVPALSNLEVPPYKFIGPHTIILGKESDES